MMHNIDRTVGRVATQLQRHPPADQLRVRHLPHLRLPPALLHEAGGQRREERGKVRKYWIYYVIPYQIKNQ